MPLIPHSQIDDTAPPREIGLLASVYDAIPFPVALLDAEGRLLHINGAFRGELSPEATATSFSALFDPTDTETIDVALSRCASSQPAECVLRMLRPNGGIRTVQVTLARIIYPLDGAILIAASFCDVTALQEQLEDAQRWETRWNNALVGSDTGVWDHNWATGQKYYSPTWRRIRGMSPGDEPPEDTASWLELVNPADRDHVVHCIARQNAGDPDYAVFEYRERHKQGHWVWIECRGDCVEWDADGKPTHIIGTDIDITARKEAEEALVRTSRRLEMALDISGVGTYESDLTTGVVDWDDRMFRIYGLRERQAVRVGSLWEHLLHPDDAERVLAKMEKHADDGTRFHDQYRVILNDGSERTIRASNMTFHDTNGHHMTVGANWDVTEDVHLHRDLERARILAEERNRALEAAKARIEHSALHDHLTSLRNRRYLDEIFDRLGTETRRDGTGVAVLHIDLDRFKQINDSLGHGAGDLMLRHAAGTLRAVAREEDFVARIGGDEFVVIAITTGADAYASSLASRIIAELTKPILCEGRQCHVGASIGIATDYGHTIDAGQLMRYSDIALYRAKRQGRNRYAFFADDESPALAESA